MKPTIRYGIDKRTVLRNERAKVCFPVINRGKLWYDSLTSEQLEELNQWYKDWLNVTETLVRPISPSWLNDKLNMEEVIL